MSLGSILKCFSSSEGRGRIHVTGQHLRVLLHYERARRVSNGGSL